MDEDFDKYGDFCAISHYEAEFYTEGSRNPVEVIVTHGEDNKGMAVLFSIVIIFSNLAKNLG